MGKLYLVIAIIAEVVATGSLKASDSFTKLIPSVIVAIGYATSFYFLTLTLRTIPVGIAYAVWSGVGIVLMVAIGFVVYKQAINLGVLVGIGFIVVGVILINLFGSEIRS